MRSRLQTMSDKWTDMVTGIWNIEKNNVIPSFHGGLSWRIDVYHEASLKVKRKRVLSRAYDKCVTDRIDHEPLRSSTLLSLEGCLKSAHTRITMGLIVEQILMLGLILEKKKVNRSWNTLQGYKTFMHPYDQKHFSFDSWSLSFDGKDVHYTRRTRVFIVY